MSKGTAKEIQMCGTTISLGDEMRVKYTTGTRMKGAVISGTVIELWGPGEPEGAHLQARLSCEWCFHEGDEILEHKKNKESKNGTQES